MWQQDCSAAVAEHPARRARYRARGVWLGYYPKMERVARSRRCSAYPSTSSRWRSVDRPPCRGEGPGRPLRPVVRALRALVEWRWSRLCCRGLTLHGPASIGSPSCSTACRSRDAGEIVDIGGPSGAGKTTLLRALARLLPDVDRALTLRDAPRTRRARRVAQSGDTAAAEGGTAPGTVRENLLLPWTLKVRSADPPADGALEPRLPTSRSPRSRSGGMPRGSRSDRPRGSPSLRTVLTGPDVLLLDEPDAALDDESAAQVSAMTERFAAEGGAVVRVRHQRGDVIATRTLRLATVTSRRWSRERARRRRYRDRLAQLLLSTGFVVVVGILSLRLALGSSATSRWPRCAPTCSSSPSVSCCGGCSASTAGCS
jgi:putative ABC transport system ATP-binding protein